MYPYLSLGCMPLALGPVLPGKYSATRLLNLSICDKKLIDALEFTHAIYEDVSQINELISIRKV